MTEETDSFPEAKTLEELIHEHDKGVECCDICNRKNAPDCKMCDFRDVKWIPLVVAQKYAIESDRANFFKERHDEDHLALELLTQKIQEMIDSKKDFLKSFHVSVEEPQYSRLWGQIDILGELKKELLLEKTK